MEVISGALHTSFPAGDPSRIGEARRHAAGLAESMGWDDVDAGRLALVVTELATNLVRHAQKGCLLLASRPDAGEVEVLAIDHGPGLADPDQCMSDGFSTGGTAGTGLGAVRRLSQDFDIHSSVPQGTVVVARLRHKGAGPPNPGAIEIRGVALAAPGESVCGDAWAACVDGARAAVMVADGLGHGPDARNAAQAAMDVFRRDPFADLRRALEQAHAELRVTRGAAVCSLALDARTSVVRGAGAGNVLARVVSGVFDRSMLSQHGTVGVQMRSLQEADLGWPDHAIIVVHTDGIESRWPAKALLPVLGRDPALAAAILIRDHCRGRDDATVVVIKRKEQP
jgi:anti-sigma regulatory factor (Ser/Thr protein kinase)